MKNIKELNDIIIEICVLLNVKDVDAIFGTSAIRQLADVRHLFLYIARYKFSRNLYTDTFLENYINKQHGILDHAVKKVFNLKCYDKQFSNIILSLEQKYFV